MQQRLIIKPLHRNKELQWILASPIRLRIIQKRKFQTLLKWFRNHPSKLILITLVNMLTKMSLIQSLWCLHKLRTGSISTWYLKLKEIHCLSSSQVDMFQKHPLFTKSTAILWYFYTERILLHTYLQLLAEDIFLEMFAPFYESMHFWKNGVWLISMYNQTSSLTRYLWSRRLPTTKC